MQYYVYWSGVSGNQYEFQIDPLGTNFKIVPGVYILCHWVGNGWQADYVGETENFHGRLSNGCATHHRLHSIHAAGSTHICTMRFSVGLTIREAIETDLRQRLNPCCNRQ